MSITEETGEFIADQLSDRGDLPGELERRAKGYGQPFKAILEKAASELKRREPR